MRMSCGKPPGLVEAQRVAYSEAMSVSQKSAVLLLPPRRRLLIKTHFITGYGLVVVFTAAVGMLILVHGGSVLNLTYPLFATLVAGVLFRYQRAVYVAFVWWVWLFTPEVRRLVDFQTGYHSVSQVMLAPLTVTIIAVLSLLLRPYVLFSRRLLPFTMFSLVLVLGFLDGGLQNGWVPATYDFITWIAPLGFAIFLLVDVKNFQANRTALMNAMMVGLLGTSLYGLYQFYHLPPWDAYWLKQSQLASAGPAVAEQVRLFGPLNSPGPYGFLLAVTLLFAQLLPGPMKIAASVFGYTALGLSLVRSAWAVWAIGTLFIFVRSRARTQIRMIMLTGLISVLVWPLVTIGPVSDAITKRIATLSDIQQDGSYRIRQGIFQSFYLTAFSNPIGSGLGINGQSTKLGAQDTSAGGDAGILQIPFEMGWIGSSVLLWSLILIILRILKSPQDMVSIAAAGGFFAMLLACISNLEFSGVTGMALWTCGCLAYQKYIV